MKTNEVPQQNAKAFMGHSKLLYAQDQTGRYVGAPSSGWEAEEIVLDQAIGEYVQLAADAWRRAKAGAASTLEYHMYRERMDVVLLAQSTGFPKWRVRRHLKSGVFQKLPLRHRQRYAEALGKTPEQLERLPEQP
ncbi:MAG: hypothetical protein KGL98_00915 [Gammaproteobacteria bacterium]|nr:hypothetical protein [Gammaproteobacteria bacterium]MBU6508765.1 hypothetical protein [Gammaproteobacteria bacterium]MDE1983071.1 hypothetical protein [Gammaproteobacteria bacterium]MDE2108189.1 hypothetical protein [Gammaproteobacteria bacterium]MDE2459784.1 hypothetical protein [Gammaproteobacteria bacterium]